MSAWSPENLWKTQPEWRTYPIFLLSLWSFWFLDLGSGYPKHFALLHPKPPLFTRHHFPSRWCPRLRHADFRGPGVFQRRHNLVVFVQSSNVFSWGFIDSAKMCIASCFAVVSRASSLQLLQLQWPASLTGLERSAHVGPSPARSPGIFAWAHEKSQHFHTVWVTRSGSFKTQQLEMISEWKMTRAKSLSKWEGANPCCGPLASRWQIIDRATWQIFLRKSREFLLVSAWLHPSRVPSVWHVRLLFKLLVS